jgi:hypothetical protein
MSFRRLFYRISKLFARGAGKFVIFDKRIEKREDKTAQFVKDGLP